MSVTYMKEAFQATLTSVVTHTLPLLQTTEDTHTLPATATPYDGDHSYDYGYGGYTIITIITIFIPTKVKM